MDIGSHTFCFLKQYVYRHVQIVDSCLLYLSTIDYVSCRSNNMFSSSSGSSSSSSSSSSSNSSNTRSDSSECIYIIVKTFLRMMNTSIDVSS